jgi:hypothetical protein
MNCIRKKELFIGIFYLFSLSLFAKEIVIGGKEGWPLLQESTNITNGKGRYGYDCIQIAANSYSYDEDTDFLIDFENSENPISNGKYTVTKNNLKRVDNTIKGKIAGLSRNMGGMNIRGEKGTYFGSEGLMGSFSIDFWLCPSISENGETIIKWESSRIDSDNAFIYQILSCYFNSGHLEWTLSNMFDIYYDNKNNSEIKLSGFNVVVPDKWSNHVLSFDAETGLLEYLMDGIVQDLVYVTSNNKEEGEVSLVSLGTPSEMEFCSEYTGKIDDIRVLRRPFGVPDYQSADNAGKISPITYVSSGGSFRTEPIRVSVGSVLNSIKAEMNVPPQTEICYYVRSGDNYFNWTDSYPEWKPVSVGEKLSNITGIYFQLYAELLPDGDGNVTPSITSISMDYTELNPPLPPFTVSAKAGNGSVVVSWNYSVDETSGGYYLYYGNRPGEYLGRIAVEGESPIDVGNSTSFTVTGLENGKIYYFAIAAYSLLDNRIVGKLSKEVYARPFSYLKK